MKFQKNTQLPSDFFDGARAQMLAAQHESGAIAWFPDGLVDPWNHLEAVMGLNCLGERDAAERGFDFLLSSQEPDGSWFGQMGNMLAIDDATDRFVPDFANLKRIRDTNHVAYIATALLHHYYLHKETRYIKRAFPHLRRAMGFVLSQQSPHGEIRWAAEAAGTPDDDALRSGCASIYMSLASALTLAEIAGEPAADWADGHHRLGEALRAKPHRFDRSWKPKSYFSMDWYYPILCGAIEGATARKHLAKDWDKFVVDGAGCRCVSHEPWVTLAETGELVCALVRAGERARAETLLGWLHQWREPDGSYYMGRQLKLDRYWPLEKPPWTAGAVILATDAVVEFTPAHILFSERAHSRPPQHGERTDTASLRELS